MARLPEPTYHRHVPEPKAPPRLWTAVALATLFGPFGLFYVSAPMAWLMMLSALVLGLFTYGAALAILWPLCPLIAAAMVWGHHDAEAETASRDG